MISRELVLRVAAVVLLMVLAVEVGGIWWELRAVRREQLKSFYSVLPSENTREMPDTGKRMLQSTLYQLRQVDTVNTVESAGQPIQVEVENQPVEVEVIR